jgi:hypothetical protein
MIDAARANVAYEHLAARFLAEYTKRQPVGATNIGDHTHDGEWPDLSRAADDETRRFVVSMRSDLGAIPRDGLDAKARVDAMILDNQLASWLFEIDEVKEADWSPLVYTGLIGDGIDPLITRSFAPAAERMKSLRARLELVPSIVAIAKARLANAPKVHVETAIDQNKGLIELCEHGLADAFAEVPSERPALEAASKKAAGRPSSRRSSINSPRIDRTTTRSSTSRRSSSRTRRHSSKTRTSSASRTSPAA